MLERRKATEDGLEVIRTPRTERPRHRAQVDIAIAKELRTPLPRETVACRLPADSAPKPSASGSLYYYTVSLTVRRVDAFLSG